MDEYSQFYTKVKETHEKWMSGGIDSELFARQIGAHINEVNRFHQDSEIARIIRTAGNGITMIEAVQQIRNALFLP
jgi:hypothetical protein